MKTWTSGATEGAANLLWQQAQAQLADHLRDHYLAGITCDQETHQDRPLCACSRVDLGWHPTVGLAVEAWIKHVVNSQ